MSQLFDRDELDAIYAACEVTIQTLDRPEPGTADRLHTIMRKISYYTELGGPDERAASNSRSSRVGSG